MFTLLRGDSTCTALLPQSLLIQTPIFRFLVSMVHLYSTYKILRCKKRRHNFLHTSPALRSAAPSIPACLTTEPWWKRGRLLTDVVPSQREHTSSPPPRERWRSRYQSPAQSCRAVSSFLGALCKICPLPSTHEWTPNLHHVPCACKWDQMLLLTDKKLHFKHQNKKQTCK